MVTEVENDVCNWCKNDIEPGDKRQVKDGLFMHKGCWKIYSAWVDEVNAAFATLREPVVKTCKRGHPFIPENRAKSGDYTYCLPCQRQKTTSRKGRG